jgi:hypothetical protein
MTLFVSINTLIKLYMNNTARDRLQATIKKISGHSIRVGATQDLVKCGQSLAIILNKGRWSKIDTLMRYAENA